MKESPSSRSRHQMFKTISSLQARLHTLKKDIRLQDATFRFSHHIPTPLLSQPVFLFFFMAASAFCSQTCEALVEPVQQTESEMTCTIAMSILPIGSIRPKIVLRRAKLVLRPAHFERVFQLGYSVCLCYPRKHNSDTLPCKSQRICTFGMMPTCNHERTYTTFLCRLGKLSNSMFRVRCAFGKIARLLHVRVDELASARCNCVPHKILSKY